MRHVDEAYVLLCAVFRPAGPAILSDVVALLSVSVMCYMSVSCVICRYQLRASAVLDGSESTS